MNNDKEYKSKRECAVLFIYYGVLCLLALIMWLPFPGLWGALSKHLKVLFHDSVEPGFR